MTNHHTNYPRFTFAVEVSREQAEVEDMLDHFEGTLHSYVSRTVVEFPATVTLYVDAYVKDVPQFLADVSDYGECDQFITWGPS